MISLNINKRILALKANVLSSSWPHSQGEVSKCCKDLISIDETFQSAYKNFHSTETALVRVQNDILCAIDNNESVILLLLDFSAAFETMDHSIMLSRLRDRFGINGTVLAWLESYLTSRKQFVQVNGCRSTQRSLERGVP